MSIKRRVGSIYSHREVFPCVRTGSHDAKLTHEFRQDSIPAKATAKESKELIHDTYIKPYMVAAGGYKVLGVKQREYLVYRIMADVKKIRGAGGVVGVVTYEWVARFNAWFGNVKGVEQVFRMMAEDKLAPTRRVFDSLMMGYAKSKDAKGWRAARQQMKRAGIPPTITTYNTALYLNEARSDVSQARIEANSREIFAAMMEDGVRPDSTTLRAMLASCRSYKNGKQIVAHFAKKLEITSLHAKMSLLRCCRWRGELDDALCLHKQLLDEGLNSVELWNALLMVAKGRDIATLEDILKKMTLSGVVPNIVTYSLVIEGIALAICYKRMNPFDTIPEAVTRAELYFTSAEAVGHGKDRMLYDALSSIYALTHNLGALHALETKQQYHGIPLSKHFADNIFAAETGGVPTIRQKFLEEYEDKLQAELPLKQRDVKQVVKKPVKTPAAPQNLNAILIEAGNIGEDELPEGAVEEGTSEKVTREGLDRVLTRHLREAVPVEGETVKVGTPKIGEREGREEMLRVVGAAIRGVV